MSGLKHVIRWEVMRNLRNKQFLIGMLITPFIFLLFAAAPQLLARLDRPSAVVYGVVDEIDGFEALKAYATSERVSLQLEPGIEAASERVRAGEIEGFFVLDEAFVQTGEVAVYSEDVRGSAPGELRAGLTRLLQQARIARSGLDPEVVAFVTAQAEVDQRPLADDSSGGAPGFFDPARMATVGGVAVLLAILILGSGAMLLQSALQEKRDRMSEVVLSSIDAQTLMGGKIVGHLILGVVQIAVWVAVGLPIAMLLLDFPIAQWIAWEVVPLAAVFFLCGYLFFAALFVGVGATMEDIQSAGNAQGMVFMLPFTAGLFIGPAINNPEGIAARVGTFLPLSSPFIIMLRTATGDLPLWEMVAATVVLLVSTAVVVLLAARLFRVGMLMYGKSATPREIWRWLRHG